MAFAIIARLDPNGGSARAQLRLEHLRYMERHAPHVVAGGPTWRDQWLDAMVLLTNFEQRIDAESFIHNEPYAASGKVFASIEVLDWTQVLPEPSPGTLRQQIDEEASRTRHP